MKKSDLENGMICGLEDGTFGIVFFGHYNWGDCIICPDGQLQLDKLNENLESCGGKCTVSTIYEPEHVEGYYDLSFKENHKEMPDSWRLIWKREDEPVELTLEEIAEKFEINVKRLRIKE